MFICKTNPIIICITKAVVGTGFLLGGSNNKTHVLGHAGLFLLHHIHLRPVSNKNEHVKNNLYLLESKPSQESFSSPYSLPPE